MRIDERRFIVTNLRSDPGRLIGDLTVADLEALVTRIVQKALKQAREQDGFRDTGSSTEIAEKDHFPEAFLATFGAWEDDRDAEKIVHEIYASRTISQVEHTL